MHESARSDSAQRTPAPGAGALVTAIAAAPDARFRAATAVTDHDRVVAGIPPIDEMRAELRELLVAHAVGFHFSGPLPPPVHLSGDDLDALIAEAKDAGVLREDGSMPADVAESLVSRTPAHRVRALQRMLVDGLVEIGHPLAGVARELARGGFRDPRVACELERAGDEALAANPSLASALYEEAQAAGADALGLAARRAQAAAATGDIDRAARILDDLFAHDNAPDLRRAADVAASVWGRRGLLERGVDIYRWLGSGIASAALAAVAMIGIGDRKGAEEMFSATGSVSPSLCAAAVDLMGRGVIESLGSRPIHALPALVRASDALTACGLASAPMPETPAALAALIALHSGEPDVALSALGDAIEGGQGGAAAVARLHLLRGWAYMHLDRPEQAQQEIAHARGADIPPTARDQLLLHALEAGLARRTDDRPALVRAWKQARGCLLHVSVDLYSLLPLGELLVTSARLRDSGRMAPHLAEAWSLLARLGNPTLWSVPLHWCAVQSAILRERPVEVAPHASALVRASAHNRVASVFSTAGRCWMSVLAGTVEVAAVETAAHELASIGLTWDGSRLAGHAAAHAEDRRDMARLLSLARQMHPAAPGSASANGPHDTAPADVGAQTQPTSDSVGLSPREREVARLVLEGKTYREIGETIFISPRTAEHHIARIRRRVGATTRSDLMTRLRLVLDDDPGE